MHRPIGIFDSGVGGLLVLETLINHLPNYNYIYFADTANLPYGEKSKAELDACAHQILSWFNTQHGVQQVVAACNTISATSGDVFKQSKVPVLGTISPVVKALSSVDNLNRVGILATDTSVKSKAIERACFKAGLTGTPRLIPCSEFVPFIEAGQLDSPALHAVVKQKLHPFMEGELDVLVFGCTHFPLLKPLFQSFLSHDMTYLDPAEWIAKDLSQRLSPPTPHHNHPVSSITFYCSGKPEAFKNKITSLTSLTANNVLLW